MSAQVFLFLFLFLPWFFFFFQRTRKKGTTQAKQFIVRMSLVAAACPDYHLLFIRQIILE